MEAEDQVRCCGWLPAPDLGPKQAALPLLPATLTLNVEP